MPKIKIECEIEFDANDWYSNDNHEEFAWFESLLNDEENIIVALHSNDIGDTIGQTNKFKYEIIYRQ
jgi:hypothetical protein